MQNLQLIDYIKTEKLKGAGYEVIKSNLLNNGWTLSDIESAWASLDATQIPVAPKKTPFWIRIIGMLILAAGIVIIGIIAIVVIAYHGDIELGAVIAVPAFFIGLLLALLGTAVVVL